jgi:hypothetical protein
MAEKKRTKPTHCEIDPQPLTPDFSNSRKGVSNMFRKLVPVLRQRAVLITSAIESSDTEDELDNTA